VVATTAPVSGIPAPHAREGGGGNDSCYGLVFELTYAWGCDGKGNSKVKVITYYLAVRELAYVCIVFEILLLHEETGRQMGKVSSQGN
jgi:hypothetical protein